jgi:hypothetical protein
MAQAIHIDDATHRALRACVAKVSFEQGRHIGMGEYAESVLVEHLQQHGFPVGSGKTSATSRVRHGKGKA